MKQYETRSKYMDAIARALGLGSRDDLSYPHRDMLGVENFSRLAGASSRTLRTTPRLWARSSWPSSAR